MMRVIAAKIVDMERCQRVIDESLEELVRQIDIEGADIGRVNETWYSSPGGARDRPPPATAFVQRHISVAVAHQPGLVAERLLTAWPKVMPTSSTV